MLLLYKILYTLALPLLALASLLRAKHRGRLLERLGLSRRLRPSPLDRPIIWFHALSVGELRSAQSLIIALRQELQGLYIVLTVSTRSGRELAERLLGSQVDLLLYSPLDLSFALRRYLRAIQPDLFILVETDFWPNWLHHLHDKNIPALLVNGRISAQAFARYHRFACFFRPIFHSVQLLAMQTEQDRAKLLTLGIPAERLAVLGNLKYEGLSQEEAPADLRAAYQGHCLWVCGSTHAGEEEILLAIFKEICQEGLALHLLLAPRQIKRSRQVVEMAHKLGLVAALRSEAGDKIPQVLILDSIGELAGCYALARLAFIGGSLVAAGGHNPIEAAVHGVPVFFGPHMEDFAEIAQDLLASGGAQQLPARQLSEELTRLLRDPAHHAQMSQAARQVVAQQQGSLHRHVQQIRSALLPALQAQ